MILAAGQGADGIAKNDWNGYIRFVCTTQADELDRETTMIRKVLFAVVLMGATAAASAATPAADPTLSVGKGTVLVSNGSQFVTAKPGQKLKAGDRVMVMPGAHASLNFADGHTSALSSGSMADIGGMSGVTSGSKKIGSMYAQAVGDTSDKSDQCKDGEGHTIACAGYIPPTPIIALFVGLTAAAIIANNSNSGDHHNDHGISSP